MADALLKQTSPRLAQLLARFREHLHTPLYLNAYLLILNQAASAGFGILYWMLAARMYPAEVVGNSSAVISTLVFISALAELSLKSAMTRFVPRAGQRLVRLVLSTYGVILLVAGLLTTGFFVLGKYFHFTQDLFAETDTGLVWLVLATMFWTVFYVQDGILMGMRQTLWVLLENSFYNFSKIVLLVLGVVGILKDGIVSSWFLPAPVVVVVINALIFSRFIPRFLKTTPLPEEPVTTRQIVTSVSGDHLGTLLAESSVRLLPLLVVNLLGKSSNAYFYQAWLVGTMLNLVASNMTASFTVEAAMDLKNIALYSRHTLRQLFLLTVPMVLVTLLAAPQVLSLFGPDYAREGTPLLRWLALAALPYALNVWYLCYARILGNIKMIIFNQGLQCAITLGLSYMWMPIYGINGVGLAWLIAQTVISIFVAIQTGPVLLGLTSDQVVNVELELQTQDGINQPGALTGNTYETR